MDRLISWAGREVLIKAVAQAIPTYAMSVFKLPTNLCNARQSIINQFWWSTDQRRRKIHWVSSNRLCDRKDDGGFSFREIEDFNDAILAKQIEDFNDAILAKQIWRFLQDESSLVYRIFRARYFPHGRIMKAELGTKPSFTCRNLWGAWEII